MAEIISYITPIETRIFADSVICENYKKTTICANETTAFTLAFKSVDEDCLPISVSAVCPGIDISIYKVGYVPVSHAKSSFHEVAHEDRGPGMYPDILYPRSANPLILSRDEARLPFYEPEETNLLNASPDGYQSVLICINENEKTPEAGTYTIDVSVTSLISGKEIANHTFTLEVTENKLPEIDFMYTNWVHYDCIADVHNVDMFSDKYFEILESYLKIAVKDGMNTLLLPMFTPPLDTFIGGEREKAQLVDIKKEGSEYTFDFTLAERFVDLALNCGIKYFEHAHFFTQWGAEHAPNIYARVNGSEERIFGWETDASGVDYRAFLEAYMPGFIDFAKKMDIEDKLFFHISDEPTLENSPTYGKAVEVISPLLQGRKSGDALDDPGFYHNGFVKTPIVAIAGADKFYGNCHDMWLYYTCGYYGEDGFEKCSNRLITTKPYRTEILGLHLYRYKASGFLHWGYNYYYDRMSRGIFDPKADPCGYKQYPGASYIVYPGMGCALPSLRGKYMSVAINDLRLLKALEEKIGYEKVMDICEEYFGEKISKFTIPDSMEKMLGFRELIKEKLRLKD